MTEEEEFQGSLPMRSPLITLRIVGEVPPSCSPLTPAPLVWLPLTPGERGEVSCSLTMLREVWAPYLASADQGRERAGLRFLLQCLASENW